MITTETTYRIQCDSCLVVKTPAAETKSEAKTLARHRGWIIHPLGDFCVECVARLDPAKRQELVIESTTERK